MSNQAGVGMGASGGVEDGTLGHRASCGGGRWSSSSGFGLRLLTAESLSLLAAGVNVGSA